MRFLTTLLTATLLCAAMLALAVHRAGDPALPPSTGLTTARTLESDGSAASGRLAVAGADRALAPGSGS